MKKLLGCILLLLLVAGLCAAAEGAPEFEYLYSDFFVYDAGTPASISAQLKNAGAASGALTARLIDQSDGSVISELVFDRKNSRRSFKFTLPDDWTGLHRLAIYVDGKKCSADFPLFVRAYEKALKRVDIQDRRMAVTIDCGSGGNTACMKWLDLLDRHNARCTFFLTARWAEDHPESVREIVARGHEIGNHSYTHPHFPTLKSYAEFYHEIVDAHRVISEISGVEPVLYRVPFGDWSYSLKTMLRSLGYRELVQWTFSARDSNTRSVSSILRSAMPQNVPNGSIALFHLASPAIDYLDEVMEYYTGTLGMRLVPVGELMFESYTIDDDFVMRELKQADAPEAKR